MRSSKPIARHVRHAVWGALVLATLGTTWAAATGSTLGGTLVLDDFGSFFVNGQIITTKFPSAPPTGVPKPGRIVVNQMYVQYMIPWGRRKWPVIMVPGSGHTGKAYETTPDGREGWATYFARRQYPVYVVDHAGRARSGFNPTGHNQAKVESNPTLLETFTTFTDVNAWETFRFGPTPGVWFPDSLFPFGKLDQYLAQLVPNTETALSRGGQFNNINALVALVDKIGPAILVVHSQSGAYGALTAIARPNLVKAVVDVEGYGACQLTPPQTSALGQVPILVVAGDHAWNGDAMCRSMVKTLNTNGGNAAFFATYEHGWRGNTHLLMMDTNNLQIADWILNWLSVVAPFPVVQVGPASGR